MYVYRKLENRLAVNKVCRYGRGEVTRGAGEKKGKADIFLDKMWQIKHCS